MPTAMIREADVLAACLKLLQLHGVFHLRNNTGATKIGDRYIRFGAPGSPDILACIQGRFWGIEVKRPGGKLSDDQKAVGLAIANAGGIYLVVHDIKELDDALSNFKNTIL